MRSVLLLCAVAVAGLPAGIAAQQAAPTSVAPPAMQRWAPGLAADTDAVLYGDIWRRPDLSPRDRSLVTLSVLVATGKTAQLEGHVGRALDNGVRPTEIGGLVTQLAYYTGWPNAVSALAVVDRVMRARGIEPASVRAAATPRSATSLNLPTVGPIAPKLAELTDRVLYGDVWRRPDLLPRDRSLVTIAALAANGDAAQLGPNIMRGLANGLTRPDIAEAMTHLAFYAGWPKAQAGVAALEASAATAGSAVPESAQLRVIAPGEAPQRGPAAHFIGTVTVTSPFSGSGGSRLGGATVTFQPGARTNWHSHALGQLLIVTAGEGRVQAEGGPVRTIRAGDTIWTAPGVKHWHGAAPGQAMTHVAVSETADAHSVTWMEPVSDATYLQRPYSTAR